MVGMPLGWTGRRGIPGGATREWVGRPRPCQPDLEGAGSHRGWHIVLRHSMIVHPNERIRLQLRHAHVMSDERAESNRPLNRAERIVFAEGVAAFAIALVRTGTDEATSRHAILRQMSQSQVFVPGILRAAADAIKSFPQPLDETPEEIERTKPIRDLMGVPSAEQELLHSMAARELLERMAADELQGD